MGFTPAGASSSALITLMENGTRLPGGLAAGTYAFLANNAQAVAGSNISVAQAARRLSPARLGAGTIKYQIDVDAIVNDTAPAITFTVGLYALTAASGATNAAMTVTFGTVISGSTVSIASPAANSLNTYTSGEFDAPADGIYVLGVVVPAGFFATNSLVSVGARLLGHQT